METLYSGDSFFTLSPLAQAGLAGLSALMALGCLALGRVLFRETAWLPLRALVGLLLFWVFVWLAPQIHYLYYMLIFDGLPLQLVIGAPVDTRYVLGLLTFSEAPSLSHHSQGAFGWSLILWGALWPWLPRIARRR